MNGLLSSRDLERTAVASSLDDNPGSDAFPENGMVISRLNFEYNGI